MKRSSVFVLVLCIACCSCTSDANWTMNMLSGTYFLALIRSAYELKVVDMDGAGKGRILLRK